MSAKMACTIDGGEVAASQIWSVAWAQKSTRLDVVETDVCTTLLPLDDFCTLNNPSRGMSSSFWGSGPADERELESPEPELFPAAACVDFLDDPRENFHRESLPLSGAASLFLRDGHPLMVCLGSDDTGELVLA